MRPSSLPMLAACPKFVGMASAATEEGTTRHAALSAWLAGNQDALKEIPEDQRDGVQWAAEYISTHAPMADHPLVYEEKRAFIAPTFERMEGTPDVTCGPVVFDLKWRQRNYDGQMACYALMLMEAGHESVTVHVLYAESQRVVVTRYDRESAEAVIMPIMTAAADPAAKPAICDYCGWCANCATCPAHLAIAKVVAVGYSDDAKVTTWHPSGMTPAELGQALWIARKVLSKWCESVEHHAIEKVLKEGMTIPGTELKTKTGRTYVADVAGAFGLAGLPQEEFLRACDLRLNTSKTYPDKVGVINLHAQIHGMKLAPAKRELLAKLEPVVKKTPDSQYLKLTGDTDNALDS